LIKWRLKEIMARYNIKGVTLASRLDIGPNAISALRNAKTMPRLDGVALNSLCNALNELAQDLDKQITPADLLDYSQDPVNTPETSELFSLRGRHHKKQQMQDEWSANG
jgi:DNA-binding Xre family transcriptional regulator